VTATKESKTKWVDTFGRLLNVRHISKSSPSVQGAHWVCAVGNARIKGQTVVSELAESLRSRFGETLESEIEVSHLPDDLKRLADFLNMHGADVPESERAYGIYATRDEDGNELTIHNTLCPITGERIERHRFEIGFADRSDGHSKIVSRAGARMECHTLLELLEQFETYHA
jgi:hypothetical protein